MQPTLFDPAILVGRYALWHRRTARCRWRLVGTADTHLGALRLMDQGGDFIVKQDGADPEAERQDADGRTELASTGSV